MRISEHFERHEFACKCIENCGHDTVDAELLTVLEAVREQFQDYVVINSGHRCPEHNRAVAGRATSMHLVGRAADFVVINHNPGTVAAWLRTKYPNQLGIGEYLDFVHVDTRSGVARWVMP